MQLTLEAMTRIHTWKNQKAASNFDQLSLIDII